MPTSVLFSSLIVDVIHSSRSSILGSILVRADLTRPAAQVRAFSSWFVYLARDAVWTVHFPRTLYTAFDVGRRRARGVACAVPYAAGQLRGRFVHLAATAWHLRLVA